jgi:photosystem II stability/assembly factor-like uncharacterized protein
MNRHLVGPLFVVGMISTASAQSPDKWETPPVFKNLKYRCVGPWAGGRVSRAVGVQGDTLTYYAATASGGVWKSTDGGQSFFSIFDDQPISSIGSIAVANSDSNVIYVGSGEANIRGNVAAGNGIYKSTDAGKTWSHVWKAIGQIGAMAVHPTNADIAYAAALGSPFGPGKERGVYRTTDGGKSWQQVLFKDPDTGACDVALDLNNPRVIFAGLWQTRRKPWEMTSGGPGSGLYVSRDGGDTWKQLDAGKAGLPEGIWGKIGVAVAPSNSARVYALIEANEGGLFRSENGGESWKRVSDHRGIRQRAWYYSTITVDPANADVVWCPQVPMLRSIDGGKTFNVVKGMHHGDNHDLWIDPKNPKRMIGANDGGVNVSTNGGATWHSPPLPISQFYHVNADNSVPYRVMGNMQDLGTASGPSHSLTGGGVRIGEWYGVGGGETGFSVPDPSDPNVVYSGEYGGILTRYDHRARQARNVSAWPGNPSGITPAELKYRFQWTAPIAFSPHDPKVLYHAAQVLFRTRDSGQTWETISGDLTRNDKNKQQWSGGPITGDNTGVEIFCTIFAVAESPKQKGVIWVGSDDGLVHVSQDDGKNWANVTAAMANFPDWGTVTCVEPSLFDAGTCYVVAEAHRLDDFKPYLWKTTDFGKTWQLLSEKLPKDVYLHAVREDPKKKGLLFIGTERGVAYSTDDGANWQPLKLNLPTVAVHDLQFKNDDLVLGTMGRSIWILDDLTPIREWKADFADKPANLLAIQPAVRWRLSGGFPHTERGSGENPPFGAILHYFVAKKPAKPATLEIRDAQDKLVVAFKAEEDKNKDDDDDGPEGDLKEPKRLIPPDTGAIIRFAWDMSYPGAEFIPKARVDSGDPTAGPLVPPGEYMAKLSFDGQTLSQKFTVRPDPRGPADLSGQHEFVMKVRDDFAKLVGTVQQLRAVRKQLQDRNELVEHVDKAKPLVTDSKALITKLDLLEEKLHNPKAKVTYDIFAFKGGARLYSQFAFLFDVVKDGDGPPTEGMRGVYTEIAAELEKLTGEFQTLVSGDLAKLNDQAKSLELPIVFVPPVKSASGKAGVGSKRWSPTGASKDD